MPASYYFNKLRIIKPADVDRNDLYTQFKQLFLQFYDPLCKYSYTLLRDQEASEDIVQDVFTRIWEKHPHMITSEKIRPYLYTAVRNSSFTYLGKKKVYSLSDQEETVEWTLSEETENDDIVHYRTLLKKGIDHLPPKCREIFLLSRSGDLSNQEIADNLGISVNTVNNQTWKAMKMLKAFVKASKLWIPLFFLTRL